MNFNGYRSRIPAQSPNLHEWENDPEFQRAVSDAKAVGAMVPNVRDWAQYKADKVRER